MVKDDRLRMDLKQFIELKIEMEKDVKPSPKYNEESNEEVRQYLDYLQQSYDAKNDAQPGVQIIEVLKSFMKDLSLKYKM